MHEFPAAGNFAGIFLQFAALPARCCAASHCNSSALRANVQIAGLVGAGNFIGRGREFGWPGQVESSGRAGKSIIIRCTAAAAAAFPCCIKYYCAYGQRRLQMKILLVDDHALIRDALRGVLKELVGDATVLEASDCHQAMRLIEAHPDLHLILLDLNLPDRDGFAMLSDVRKRYATISLVVLSASRDRETVIRALDLGALGFIPKSAPRDVMVNALRLIFGGGVYIPPEALARSEPKEQQPVAERRGSPADLGFTERQMEVLALMMQGKSNKAISRILDVAEPTVKHHVTAILKALKVANRTEAVVAAGSLGWQLPQVPER